MARQMKRIAKAFSSSEWLFIAFVSAFWTLCAVLYSSIIGIPLTMMLIVCMALSSFIYVGRDKERFDFKIYIFSVTIPAIIVLLIIDFLT